MKGGRDVVMAEARERSPFRLGVVTVMALLATLLCSSAAWAKTFTVTNTHDSGAGSLRAAMNGANSLGGADRIEFADGVSGTVTLQSPLPFVRDPAGLAIVGNSDVTVSGNRSMQVFEVVPGAQLAIRSLTIADGRADGIGNENDGIDRVGGGAFVWHGGALTVSHCVFSDNKALIDPQFVEDWGAGGAIFNGANATLEVTHTTFSGNSATNDGGAIYNWEPSQIPVLVTNSSFFGNSARIGGGIASEDYLASGGAVELRVLASTFSGNSAKNRGGAIYHEDDTVALKASIVADSPSGGNCAGDPLTYAGFNVEDADTCGFRKAAGSLPNTNPRLDPDGLQRNGGPTKTIALRPSSPAVDLVGENACPSPTTDQRGVKRPQGASCDAGAYELVE